MKIGKFNLFLVILGIFKVICPFINAMLNSYENLIEIKSKKKPNGKKVKHALILKLKHKHKK